MHFNPRILLLFFQILAFQITYAQKTFNVSIQIPSCIDSKKIKISYDNGKKIISVADSFYENKINFSGTFYSKYATLMVTYPRTKTSLHYNEFFVQTKPSSILFLICPIDSLENPFEKSVLSNVLEIKNIPEAKKLTNFALTEFNDFVNFYKNYGAEINISDSMQNIANLKDILYSEKQLEYVKKNGKDYYSFWIFRTQLVNAFIDTKPKTLLTIFNAIFPEEFKKSVEGREILKKLNGRIITQKNNKAPDFDSKDIFGKVVSLKKYKGKFVLLDFWASWCSPCLEKIPLITQIRNTYPKDKLEIIGVTYDTDSSAFIKAIAEYKMNWKHIYGDINLRNVYGNKAIPSLYLIDTKGVIIYSNWEAGDDKLLSLLATLIGNKK